MPVRDIDFLTRFTDPDAVGDNWIPGALDHPLEQLPAVHLIGVHPEDDTEPLSAFLVQGYTRWMCFSCPLAPRSPKASPFLTIRDRFEESYPSYGSILRVFPHGWLNPYGPDRFGPVLILN